MRKQIDVDGQWQVVTFVVSTHAKCLGSMVGFGNGVIAAGSKKLQGIVIAKCLRGRWEQVKQACKLQMPIMQLHHALRRTSTIVQCAEVNSSALACISVMRLPSTWYVCGCV
jgi:hypothetical protein